MNEVAEERTRSKQPQEAPHTTATNAEEYEFDSDENECESDEDGDEEDEKASQPPAAKKARVEEKGEEDKQASEPEATLTLQVRIPGGKPLVVTAGSRERVGAVMERVCKQAAERDGKPLGSDLVLYTAYPRAVLTATTTLGDAGVKDRTLLVLEHKAP